MGIFKKDKSSKKSAKSVGGVIKNGANADYLFWRYPADTFKNNIQLIVNPGDEAIFIKNGNIECVFENGSYYLTTEKFDFLKKCSSGKNDNFCCEILFFRKACTVEILWGTDSPIQVRDKVIGIATTLRARGAYKMQISDVGVFLEKLAGSRVDYLKQEDINNYFAIEFQSKIKSTIAAAIDNSSAELLGIDAHLDALSHEVQKLLAQVVTDYGLKCVNFAISAIDIDDSELRKKYDEIGMAGLEKIRNAQADKTVFGILGEDWGRQQSVDLMHQAIEGSKGNTYVGANPYAGMSESFSSSITGNSRADDLKKLTDLKAMLDAGLITRAEYDAKKTEILGRM